MEICLVSIPVKHKSYILKQKQHDSMHNFVKNKTYSSVACFKILLTIYSECVGVKQAYIFVPAYAQQMMVVAAAKNSLHNFKGTPKRYIYVACEYRLSVYILWMNVVQNIYDYNYKLLRSTVGIVNDQTLSLLAVVIYNEL